MLLSPFLLPHLLPKWSLSIDNLHAPDDDEPNNQPPPTTTTLQRHAYLHSPNQPSRASRHLKVDPDPVLPSTSDGTVLDQRSGSEPRWTTSSPVLLVPIHSTSSTATATTTADVNDDRYHVGELDLGVDVQQPALPITSPRRIPPLSHSHNVLLGSPIPVLPIHPERISTLYHRHLDVQQQRQQRRDHARYLDLVVRTQRTGE